MSGVYMSKEEGIRKLEQEIRDCKRCGLWKTRNKPVIGEGPLDAKIMFIGEAPGYNEDLQGKPFVGRAGKVFDELFALLDMKKEDVYIGNILKCRPPGNRNPLQEEIHACTSYLDRQIAIIKPELICPLGNFAVSYIFEKFGLKREKMGEIHGKVFNITNLIGIRRIIPLYHPASATYNSAMKLILIQDFKAIKAIK